MQRIFKKITSGASYYRQTEAVSRIQDAVKTGFIPCASGDDYKLSRKEKKKAISHMENSKEDLVLESGPFNPK